MQLTRRMLVILALVVIAAAAAGAIYVRYRVDQAAADCPMPAPPEKPATPPPHLPGFQTGDACGPGEAPHMPAPPGSTGKKP